MKEIKDFLFQLGAIQTGQFLLRGGQKSNFYIDVKKAYGNPDFLNLVGKLIYDKMSPNVTCIAGAGYGGIPLAISSSLYSGKPVVLLRDLPKDHGTTSNIEGYIPNSHDKIALVDDVFSTGDSLRNSIRMLSSTNATILGCYVIVKRGEGKLPISLDYLLTATELLNFCNSLK